MFDRKFRRLTIRFRKRGEAAGVARETTIGAPAVVRVSRPAPVVRHENRRPAHAPPPAVAAATASPIERLVAEAREHVLMMSRKGGRGVAEASVLARLAATGEVSRRQHEAGRRYAEIVREHDTLLGRSVTEANASEGDAGVARHHYRTAMARYDLCRSALRNASGEDRMAAAVVDAVAVSNWELPDLTPSLRIGLNHLARALDGVGVEGAAGRDGAAGSPG